MSVLARIVQIGIFAMMLALYNLWFQDSFLAMFGENVGFGEVALGYFIVGIIAYITSAIVMRGLRNAAREEQP